MRRPFLMTALLAATLALIPFGSFAETKKAEFFGGIETEYPAWFKDSFLDLKEDLAEAYGGRGYVGQRGN